MVEVLRTKSTAPREGGATAAVRQSAHPILASGVARGERINTPQSIEVVQGVVVHGVMCHGLTEVQEHRQLSVG